MKHLLTLLSAFIIFNGFAQVPVLGPINGPTVMCSSTPVNLTYTVSATNSPLFYSWTYISSTTGNTINTNTNVQTIPFYWLNETYTLICSASNGSGSSATQSLVVNVFETPNVNFSGSATFCQGSSTSLQASSTMFSASSTVAYNWAPSTGLNTTSGPNVIANPSTPTNYTVTAINGVCSNTAQITVAPFETMSVSFSGATTFCQGSSTNLSASSTIFSASPTISYLWSPGIGLNTTIGSFVNANPSVSTTYTVTASLGGSCFNTGQITVGPNGFSGPVINALATPTSVCYGEAVTLNATGANSYTWSNGAQNGIPFNVYSSDTYYVNGIDANGCSGSSSVSINVNSSSSFYVTSSDYPLISGQSATLTINGNAGTTYSVNGVSSGTTIVVSPTVTTNYTVTSNNNGCLYSLIFTQQVGFVMGIESINTIPDNYFKIYPNPNNGEFNIKSSTKETVRIINELGEVVRVIDINPEQEYHISELSSGIYVILSDKSKTKIIVTN